MNYTFSKTINDCVYSIDMLYIRGYLTCSTVSANSYLESVCDSHRSFKGRCKYSWFQDMYLFDGVTLYVGLFDDFDKATRKWSVVPMIEIRFNPNKYADSPLVDYFLSVSDSRYIRLFDFACDVPCAPSYILVDSARTKSFLNNGDTRYYGVFGHDKRVKVYDKQKELLQSKQECPNPLTRIELSITTYNLDEFIKERFYRLDKLNVELGQIDGLNDTDMALLNMFFRLKAYEPNISLSDFNLGRKKEKKIRDALLSSLPCSSDVVGVNFSKEVVLELLGMVSSRYDCSIKTVNRQLLTERMIEDADELPFNKK